MAVQTPSVPMKRTHAHVAAPKPGKTGLGLYAMDGRLVVSTVNGPAAKTVQPGDRLLKVGGQPVAQLNQAIFLLKGFAGTRVGVQLERGGRPYDAVLERF